MARGARETALALGLALLAGCGGGGGAAGTGASPEPEPSPVACSSDDDCVLLEDCCGCAAGGRKLAVHRERLEQAIQREAGACEQRSCDSGASDHPSCEATAARCIEGRCTVE